LRVTAWQVFRPSTLALVAEALTESAEAGLAYLPVQGPKWLREKSVCQVLRENLAGLPVFAFLRAPRVEAVAPSSRFAL